MTAADPFAPRRAAVFGGGAVGAFVARLCAERGIATTTVDVDAVAVQPGIVAVRADVFSDPAAELAAAADVVVLALPEAVALDAVASLADALRPETVVLDTLSVKAPYAAALTRMPGVRAVGANPMFAPTLDPRGRAVAVVRYRDDAAALDWTTGLFSGAGSRAITVEPQQHDDLCGALQALTHATILSFGAALADLDLDPGDLLALALPPFVAQSALLARVTSANPHVYRDIQHAGPAAAAARSALAAAVSRLDAASVSDDPDEFTEFVRSAAQGLGDARDRLAETAAAMLTDAGRTP
ncbi:prephenate dehydrogenase/arogenate dehydrogenase family protein [Rhodococcus rhodnii]|uniref:Bifunctional chorismate mutase n=1 Tax=Rhodococcus rhodnii LMG 5362 TaxID=1273125 RepID=R7WM73_9NOCA|nr:prephenate dehydrogenase/arogenate dehydrogenase family protein [Rhodococcus rhodnii]EOM76365.1 bifunctional chorismate mutase [Rhodococcus rhodnii LMG 5362]